ncbi:MAG: DUF2141 domain-containing protein [Archangiaceae bacterium]|nr:DUF2141 domain-containing protein [Archangiaceae bacterium]
MKKTLLVVLFALPAAADDLVVDVALRSDTGVVHCNLWKSADGFPREYQKAATRVEAPAIKGKQARCTFAGVAAGTYAISVFHDEDGDGVLKTNFVGAPKEPLGFSNDARGSFGPPKFDDAKFAHDGKARTLAIAAK